MGEVRDVVANGYSWREAGDPRATMVVFLHGLGGSRLSWEPQLAELSQSYRCVAWDLPGYGLAAPLPCASVSFADLAAAVVGLLDELNVKQVHLVGISFGGMIAQYVAAWSPVRVRSLALLATSPAFGLDGTSAEAWRAARLAPLDAGLEPSDFSGQVLRAIAGPNITDEALAGQRLAMAEVSGAALRRSIDCLVTHDSRPVLKQISAPTICLVGAFDNETPAAYADALAAGIAGAHRVTLPQAGHLINVEDPAGVNDTLCAHFARAEQL
jgi:3-oxoadipate enol-lactonase